MKKSRSDIFFILDTVVRCVEEAKTFVILFDR